MSHKVDIHKAQTEILRTLLFTPSASYTELCKQTGFSSDHFNFHIKKLVEAGLVEKTKESLYGLTADGKEYANQLDTDDRTIEKQPKTSVLLVIRRTNDQDQTEYLFQKRLKQPFYGYFMFATGKVRWGESFQEAAERELEEETGLTGTFILNGITRKRDFESSTKKLLEDKIFIVMVTDDAKGSLIEKFEGGENYWMTREEFNQQEKVMKGPNVVFVHLQTDEPTYKEEDFFFDTSEY